MKFKLFIDKEREEEVIVYAHEKSRLVSEIESLIEDSASELIGFNRGEAVILELCDIYCFTVEDGKLFAIIENERFLVKSRLYKVEENLPQNFVKINQSCIANITKIKKFDVTVSGALKVIFKNGYTDYVSRRNIKNVKERLGL